MPQVQHRQYDEAPSRFFTLTFPGAETVPALNNDDKVTMLIGQTGGSDLAVALTVVDPATREVRWDPAGQAVAIAGTHSFVVRVTESNGRSYTHPETGTWDLVIDRTAPDTDLPDPA